MIATDAPNVVPETQEDEEDDSKRIS